MKKQRNTILGASVLVIVVIMVMAIVAYGQGSISDAKKLMEYGMYRQAEAVFQVRTEKDSGDADSWYWWGVCRLKQGYQADEMFLKAVGLKPKYNESVAPLYRQEAETFREKGRTDTAIMLFDKAIEWNKSLKPEIAQSFFDAGQYDLAVRYNPGLADKVAEIFYKKGEVATGEASLPYYRKAATYSSKYLDTIKGKLLTISQTKYEEKDIRFWRNAASEFGTIPPDYKIYQPGTYTFSLKAGEKTDHWIMFPLECLSTMAYHPVISITNYSMMTVKWLKTAKMWFIPTKPETSSKLLPSPTSRKSLWK